MSFYLMASIGLKGNTIDTVKKIECARFNALGVGSLLLHYVK